MKICPGCHREVADDAEVCECGLRFDEIAAEPVADKARHDNSPAEPQEKAEEAATKGVKISIYDSGEIDLDEIGLDEGEIAEVDLDAVDLDEADLDSEEIDLSEEGVDMEATEEFIVAQEPPPLEGTYSRREALTRKKGAPPLLIIVAHFVIILAAVCIFYYKSTKNSLSGGGGDSAPDYDAPQHSYVTKSDSPGRAVEDVLLRLPLSCHIAHIEKESHASPEVTVFLRKYGYRSIDELRGVIEADTVRVYQGVLKEQGRVKIVHVTAQAMFSRTSGWENAIVVSFDRSRKLTGKQKPREILAAFSAQYHAQLLAKK